MGNESSLACPHCNADNDLASSFCGYCGKALPVAAAAGPRIITDSALPATSAGQQLVSEELKKQVKKAKSALLAVAVIQTLFGLLIFAATKASLGPGETIQAVFFIGIFGVAALFFGLYAWARRSPLPAAIVGLAVFVTLHLIDAIMDPTQIARGIIMKVLIIAMLVQAIKAGLKHKQLMPRLQAA